MSDESSFPIPQYLVNLNKYRVSSFTYNGRVIEANGYYVGLATDKGFVLAIFTGNNCYILGKDGVARQVNKSFQCNQLHHKIGHVALARCLGLIDTVQYAVTAPILFTGHMVLCLGGGLGTLVLLPGIFHKSKVRQLWKRSMNLFILNLGSVVGTSVSFLLTPLEIIAPEINFKLLKMHKWGNWLQESEI